MIGLQIPRCLQRVGTGVGVGTIHFTFWSSSVESSSSSSAVQRSLRHVHFALVQPHSLMVLGIIQHCVGSPLQFSKHVRVIARSVNICVCHFFVFHPIFSNKLNNETTTTIFSTMCTAQCTLCLVVYHVCMSVKNIKNVFSKKFSPTYLHTQTCQTTCESSICSYALVPT